VEFRVLGRLDVIGNAGRITLRGTKSRGLIGLLLAARGRAVGADRIVRYVWQDDPAALARVKSSIHQLRKLFGANEDRLVTGPGGYSLQLAPDELDASVFEALVTQAAATADRERAVGLLSQAVSLWRGPAFEEFADTEWASGEANRLDTLRMRALEDLVDAELNVGRHAQAVDRLEALVVDHPLREHFWGQLMVALYRCGRQGEALRAFKRVRGMLADELGISPSSELVGLERRILDQDPALASTAGPAAGDVGVVPGNTTTEFPSGTVTLLFTDIESSTRLLHDLGSRYERYWRNIGASFAGCSCAIAASRSTRRATHASTSSPGPATPYRRRR
jgi:DNA-binding SARP family transcriptional activator